MEVATQLRCVIGDRSEVFIRGLARLLQANGMSVLGDATSPAEMRRFVATCECDLVVVGFEPIEEAIGAVMHVDPPALVLSSAPSPEDLAKALAAGAKGLVPKDASETELVAAVQDVAAGRVVIGSDWAPSLVRYFGIRASTEDCGVLTAREREVVQQLVEGLSNKQMAHTLGIAEQTVKNHLRSIMSKVGVSTRIELCRWASEHRFQPLPASLQEPGRT